MLVHDGPRLRIGAILRRGPERIAHPDRCGPLVGVGEVAGVAACAGEVVGEGLRFEILLDLGVVRLHTLEAFRTVRTEPLLVARPFLERRQRGTRERVAVEMRRARLSLPDNITADEL